MTAHGQHAAPRFRRFRVWPRPAAEVTETAAEVTKTAAEVPAQDTPPAPEAPDVDVDYDASYDHPGREQDAPGGHPDDTMQFPKPLPQRSPGAAIPPALVPALRAEPADVDMLRKVRDALKPRPVAWLRVHERDGSEAVEALYGMPEFAGTDTLPDGTVIAGAFLGIHGRATWLFDAVDPAQVRAAITALTAVHDALVAAQGDETEGEAA